MDRDTATAGRRTAVANALAVTEMEGGRPSDYCLRQLELFAAGEITAAEMRERVVVNLQAR
jgi:hypothetical protein